MGGDLLIGELIFNPQFPTLHPVDFWVSFRWPSRPSFGGEGCQITRHVRLQPQAAFRLDGLTSLDSFDFNPLP